MAWHDLCKPRSLGGVGIRHLRTCNLAVLAKQCCRIFLHPDTLLSQIFRARHFPRTSLVYASISNRSSATWRSLLAPRLYIRQGLRWRVGDGNLVYTWDDPWLTNDGSVWIPIGGQHNTDHMIWHYSPHGNFTVRSCYHMIMASLFLPSSSDSANASHSEVLSNQISLWKLKLPPQICLY